MLNMAVQPHRPALRSGAEEAQKLFVLLKVAPTLETTRLRPPLSLAMVVDTSGSMLEYVDGAEARRLAAGQRPLDRFGEGCGVILNAAGTRYETFRLPLPVKIDQAIDAAHRIVNDTRLTELDRMAVVRFSEEAEVLLPMTSMERRADLHAALDRLRGHGGGTCMGEAMQAVGREMAAQPVDDKKWAFILTDGETQDEPLCLQVAQSLGERNVTLVPIGIGETYNEELLVRIADLGRGHYLHLRQVGELHEFLSREIGQSVREVVTDLRLRVSPVKDVTVERVSRVFPSVAAIETASPPYRLGNIMAQTITCFVVELTIAKPRPPCRTRLAQFSLTGAAPGLGMRQEFPPWDVTVDFTTDQSRVGSIDAEVMHYVQQLNMNDVISKVTSLATQDVAKARETLVMAQQLTQRVGNQGMTQVLGNALEELNRTGTISPHTSRTMRSQGRTETLPAGGASLGFFGLDDAEIRRITGT